jgi:hypothetical protein
LAAAQLNVNMDDEHLLKQPNFWPEGIFMKPWLPWEQFINEHSIEQKHGRYYPGMDNSMPVILLLSTSITDTNG